MEPGSPVDVWKRALKLSAVALPALFPAAAFMFVGTAIRYAPFVWVAAALGVFPALAFARRAARLDLGRGEPEGKGVPELPAYLAYGYSVALLAAAMSTLGALGPLAPAVLIALSGPFHALFLLGWRSNLVEEGYPGGGSAAFALTIVAIVGLAWMTVYDRYVRNPPPVGSVPTSGTLLILGGVDSTSDTGALSKLDPRDVGFSATDTEVMSYRGPNLRYSASDTRADLDDIALQVSRQVEQADPPRLMIGHSQAALIVDRLLDQGLTTPDASAELSAPPPLPPTLSIPPPGETGRGKPGGDVARGLAAVFDLVGLPVFDVDAPNSPVHLDAVVVLDPRTPRLAVWALGDSVWLQGDWRRPGERNVVALTDHVGTANDGRALFATSAFFAGRPVATDESSWRGFLVSVLRYSFEPWRPI
jgi:hypothetical protein